LPLWSRSELAPPAAAWGVALAIGLSPGTAAAQTDSAAVPASQDRMAVTDQVYTGWKYFQVYCSRCHGDEAVGTMAAPDLTYSVSEEGGVTADSFAFVVRQGATDSTAPDRRMRGFEDLLDQELIDALFAYVRARSDSSLPPGRPHRASTAP
jgi:mono/diheme cytochrome c family protein